MKGFDFAVSELLRATEAPINIRAVRALPDVVGVLAPWHYPILADAPLAALEQVLEKARSVEEGAVFAVEGP